MRRFGLWPWKGALLPGFDADLVVFDPDETWVVDPAELTTAAGWSPYAGRTVRGRVAHVFARGEHVLDRGEVVARPGRGAFVPASGARATVGSRG